MDLHDGANYPACYENCKQTENGASASTDVATSSFCMYDFGVVYLLDDHKRALSNSLQSYLAVSGMMPTIPDGDYQGHRSLVSSATCKSLSDLPDSSSMAPSSDQQSFSESLAHERAEDGEYGCPSCQAHFPSIAQLKVHRRAHQGERPFSCTLCHVSFSTKQQLLDHVLTHNTLDKTYVCRLCKTPFMRPGLLRKHMESHYVSTLRGGDALGYAASNCADDDLDDDSPGEGHSPQMHSMANGEAAHSMHSAAPSHALKEQSMAPTARGNPPVGLVFEGRRVGLLGSSQDPALPSFGLHAHAMPAPAPPPQPVVIIPRPVVVAPPPPVIPLNAPGDDAGGKKPFVCKVCGKIFTQSGNLSRHRLVHSQEKPFQCNVCSKRFSQKSHLKTHQNVHSGERAFQCQICEKKFSQLGHLKTHINVHLRVTTDGPIVPAAAPPTSPAHPDARTA